MKRNAVATLIKDIIFAAIAWGIFHLLLGELWGADLQPLALFFAGLPFGWRWSSKIITAVSLKGIGLKFSLSVLIGFFAIFIVLICDVIACIAELVQNKQSRYSSVR